MRPRQQGNRQLYVEDGQVEHALNEAFDRTVPHRRQAKAQMQAIADERDLLQLDIYNERLAHKVGSMSERASTSAAIKMHAFRQQLAAQESGGQEGGAE